MRVLNQFAGGASVLSGLAMFVAAGMLRDFTTALSGFGAVTMGVLLFQVTDLRERVKRIESVMIDTSRNSKSKTASK